MGMFVILILIFHDCTCSLEVLLCHELGLQTADILNTNVHKFVCLSLNSGKGVPFECKQCYRHKFCRMKRLLLSTGFCGVVFLFDSLYRVHSHHVRFI